MYNLINLLREYIFYRKLNHLLKNTRSLREKNQGKLDKLYKYIDIEKKYFSRSENKNRFKEYTREKILYIQHNQALDRILKSTIARDIKNGHVKRHAYKDVAYFYRNSRISYKKARSFFINDEESFNQKLRKTIIAYICKRRIVDDRQAYPRHPKKAPKNIERYKILGAAILTENKRIFNARIPPKLINTLSLESIRNIFKNILSLGGLLWEAILEKAGSEILNQIFKFIIDKFGWILVSVSSILGLKICSNLIEDKMESGIGADYSRLAEHLKNGDFKKADQETLCNVLWMAGEDKMNFPCEDTRYSLKKEKIKEFHCEDLRTIDELWQEYSQKKYGFGVQKEIWIDTIVKGLSDKDIVDKDSIYQEFAKKVGWKEKLIFDRRGKKGKLPTFARHRDVFWPMLSRIEQCEE